MIHNPRNTWSNLLQTIYKRINRRKCKTQEVHDWRLKKLASLSPLRLSNWLISIKYCISWYVAALRLTREFKQISTATSTTAAGSKKAPKWRSAHAWKWPFAVAPNPTTWIAVFWRSRYYVQGSKFKFEFGSTCATRCKFLGALPNFRRTAENLRSTVYNVGSIYFKKKKKAQQCHVYLSSSLCYFYFSPVIDKTQPICYTVIPLWFLILISVFDSTAVTKENLHLKKNTKLTTTRVSNHR